MEQEEYSHSEIIPGKYQALPIPIYMIGHSGYYGLVDYYYEGGLHHYWDRGVTIAYFLLGCYYFKKVT